MASSVATKLKTKASEPEPGLTKAQVDEFLKLFGRLVDTYEKSIERREKRDAEMTQMIERLLPTILRLMGGHISPVPPPS
jgi:F0F1-type ATP synthase alpha subunit